MRPVFIRELKELSPALALLVAAGVIAGANFTGPLSRELDDLLMFPLVGGLALGALQGALDRWRTVDLFALHRPIPAARMEACRTLAGATVVLVALIALVLAHRVATAIEMADFDRLRVRIHGYNRPEHLGAAEIAILAAVLLAAWAVARFGAGAVRIRWAVPALVAAPLAASSILTRVAGVPTTTLAILGVATLFSLGTGLCLAGGRR
jgi:hypothetical protein